MSKLRRSWIVMMVAIGLFAAAGVAWAEEAAPGEDAPVEDTAISFGYDEETRAFVVHTATAEDDDFDCMPEGEVILEYGDTGFKLTEGEGDDGTAVECEPTAELAGAVVGGPNGQINHGQFMKAFHSIVGKEARGCLNRIMARSDLGKGDHQIRTSDVAEGDGELASGDLLTIEFTTLMTACEHGKQAKGDDHPGNSTRDKADRKGGNSANAPGRTK